MKCNFKAACNHYICIKEVFSSVSSLFPILFKTMSFCCERWAGSRKKPHIPEGSRKKPNIAEAPTPTIVLLLLLI